MKQPSIHKTAVLMQGAVVIGDVAMHPNSSLWYNAVARGDIGSITIGEGSNVQDCGVLHTGAGHALTIGQDVTVGHGCILHGCTIQNGAVVGMGSVVMDGAVLEEGCMLGAGSLVTRGAVVPRGTLAMGRPAKVVRPLTEEELQRNRESCRLYAQRAKLACQKPAGGGKVAD
ncbi:gamma carbonic anhydrase family protein [Ruminococcaceae bacterium OttesenSCG-928-O06]|nr:gamma carbonic anhydrase family protein [Ruminococcaceae bacterium OttesenSCG-928-O06]